MRNLVGALHAARRCGDVSGLPWGQPNRGGFEISRGCLGAVVGLPRGRVGGRRRNGAVRLVARTHPRALSSKGRWAEITDLRKGRWGIGRERVERGDRMRNEERKGEGREAGGSGCEWGVGGQHGVGGGGCREGGRAQKWLGGGRGIPNPSGAHPRAGGRGEGWFRRGGWYEGVVSIRRMVERSGF